MLEIDIHKFYGIGVWLFGIIALMNTVTFSQALLNGRFDTIFSLISSTASLAFNFVLFGFFLYLSRGLPPKDLKKGSIADMEFLLNQKEVKK